MHEVSKKKKKSSTAFIAFKNRHLKKIVRKKKFGQMFVLICTKFRIIQLKKKNPGLDTQLNPFDNKPFKK